MNYQNILSNVVIPKLREFGRPLILQKQANLLGNWVKTFSAESMQYVWENTNTGEIAYSEPDISSISYSINMLVDTFNKKEVDDSFVKAGDLKVYMTPDVAPDIGDTIEIDDKIYFIYHFEMIKPASVTLLYVLYVRDRDGKV